MVSLDQLHRALLHTKLGDVKRAEEEFQAAVAGRANDASAWLDRARVFVLLGKKERALADFAKALELSPQDPNIRKEYDKAKR